MQMPEQSVNKSSATVWYIAGLSALAALLLAASFAVHARPDNWNTPIGSVFGYDAQGVVYNMLTGDWLANAEVACEGYRTAADSRGRFVIRLRPREYGTCQIGAPGFEDQKVAIRSGQSLDVGLVPDPMWTLGLIVSWEKTGRFGKQYDLLHPDVRRSWTREEFARLLNLTEYRHVIAVEYMAPYHLKKWDYYGEIYHDTVVVPTWITFERDGQRFRQHWEAHLVKANGFWHWFREPGTEIIAVTN